MKQYIKEELIDLFKDDENNLRIIRFYIKYIESCELKDFKKYHRHHIIPKCIDESKADDSNNIVKLSLRHHIVAHLILAKIKNKLLCCSYNRVCSNHKLTKYEKDQRKAITSFVKSRPVVNLITYEVFDNGAKASTFYGHKPSAVSTAISRRIKLHEFYKIFVMKTLDFSQEMKQRLNFNCK